MVETTDSEWSKYFCKSGELLFYYSKVTGEHRWPTFFNGFEGGQAIYGHRMQCASTQTDDYDCINGCLSPTIHIEKVVSGEFLPSDDSTSSIVLKIHNVKTQNASITDDKASEKYSKLQINTQNHNNNDVLKSNVCKDAISQEESSPCNEIQNAQATTSKEISKVISNDDLDVSNTPLSPSHVFEKMCEVLNPPAESILERVVMNQTSSIKEHLSVFENEPSIERQQATRDKKVPPQQSNCTIDSSKPLIRDPSDHEVNARDNTSRDKKVPPQQSICSTCEICLLELETPLQYHKHLEDHCEESHNRCPVCKQNFSKRSFLMRHLKTHSGSKGRPNSLSLLEHTDLNGLTSQSESDGPNLEMVSSQDDKVEDHAIDFKPSKKLHKNPKRKGGQRFKGRAKKSTTEEQTTAKEQDNHASQVIKDALGNQAKESEVTDCQEEQIIEQSTDKSSPDEDHSAENKTSDQVEKFIHDAPLGKDTAVNQCVENKDTDCNQEENFQSSTNDMYSSKNEVLLKPMDPLTEKNVIEKENCQHPRTDPSTRSNSHNSGSSCDDMHGNVLDESHEDKESMEESLNIATRWLGLKAKVENQENLQKSPKDEASSSLCTTCRREFSQTSHLLSHLRTYSGKTGHPKMYTCWQCNKTYSRKATFEQHKMIHSEVKNDVKSCLMWRSPTDKTPKRLKSKKRTHCDEEPCDALKSKHVKN